MNDVGVTCDAVVTVKDEERLGSIRGFDGDAIDLWRHAFELAIPDAIAGGTYVGKKVVDLVASVLEKRLSSTLDDAPGKSGIHTIVIYGPHGE